MCIRDRGQVLFLFAFARITRCRFFTHDRSPWCVTPAWRAVDSLFRRFAVKVFVVGLRVGAGMVEDAVPMIRRCIERVKLQWNTAGIDDVVMHPCLLYTS